MEKVYYKDTFVAIRNCTFRSRNHEEGKTCWCCNDEFKDDEKCILLINNYKYIPNMILHKDCFERVHPDYRDKLCENIERDYREYKELAKVFN